MLRMGIPQEKYICQPLWVLLLDDDEWQRRVASFKNLISLRNFYSFLKNFPYQVLGEELTTVLSFNSAPSANYQGVMIAGLIEVVFADSVLLLSSF